MGANTIALTPVPTSTLELAAGVPNDERIGNKYANVFPVPVGEIAARSRPFGIARNVSTEKRREKGLWRYLV